MIPELTRPITITMVPALDWITAVIRAPSSTPRRVEAVSFCRILCILPPATRSRPEPMMDIPYKNSAMPPSSWIASLAVIISSLEGLSLPPLRPGRDVFLFLYFFFTRFFHSAVLLYHAPAPSYSGGNPVVFYENPDIFYPFFLLL